MYKVIRFFTDLQDFNHPYNVGDEFPRVGNKVTDERIAELSGYNNKLHTPLIKLIVENVPVKENVVENPIKEEQYTKTDINRMSKDDLVELSKKENIQFSDEDNGSTLKKMLIAHFNL